MKLDFKVIVVGLAAGFVSGLFSTGGGLILVPSFLYLIHLGEKESRATSIFCILPMVIVSSFFYLKNNLIQVDLGLKCAVGGCIGSFLGSKILLKIPNPVLKFTFAVFLMYIGIKMLGIS